MIDKLNELCMWLSHQKGMMSQDYAKELAKIIVQLRQQADRIAELEKALDWIATVNAMDYEYQDVAKSLLKERHGIK